MATTDNPDLSYGASSQPGGINGSLSYEKPQYGPILVAFQNPFVPPVLVGATVAAPTNNKEVQVQQRCDDVNGNGTLIRPDFVVLTYNTVTGALLSTATVNDAGAAYVPVNPSVCPAQHDMEIVSKCFEDTATVPNRFTRLDFVDASVTPPIVRNTLWQNAAGVMSATAPAGPLVQCPLGDPNTIKTGSYLSVALFTQASLPGIAAGGILQSFTVSNMGLTPFVFTGTDGNAVSFPSGATRTWGVDGSADTLSGWSINATGTTCLVSYTYR